MNGGTGVGKTTALYSNTSIWGHPVKLCTASKDSLYSHMNRMERFKNLVGNLDERSNVTPKEVSEYLYCSSEGQQRNRLKQSGNEERFRGDPWRMTQCSTGNVSYWEMLLRAKGNPEPEMQRVLEFTVVKYMTEKRMRELNEKEGFTKELTDELITDVQRNYGTFTIEYVQYIIKNRVHILEIYKGIRAKLDKAANLTPANRFWSAGCAVTLTACTIANALGIISYDAKKLYKWTVQELLRAKQEVENTAPTVSEIVANFMSENWVNILRIMSTDDARDEVANLVVPEQNPRMKFVGRYETDTKLLFIPAKELRNYLVDQFLNYSSTVKLLKEEMGATMRMVHMSKGTSLNLPSQYCIVVKMEHTGNLDDTPQTG